MDMQNSSFCRLPYGHKLGGKLFQAITSMADDISDCPPTSAPTMADGGNTSAVTQLPTLQRNALRKIFDRHDFTPEEVAMLGYRRLQQAEGIGNKGLAAITEWLHRYGFDLKPPELAANPRQSLPKRMRRNIESAVRLLRTHGYVVQKRVEQTQGGKGAG